MTTNVVFFFNDDKWAKTLIRWDALNILFYSSSVVVCRDCSIVALVHADQTTQ